MKKVKFLPLICAVAALLLLALSIFGLYGSTSANAASDSGDVYKFSVTSYDVTYDISSNCSIAVTEDITIYYEGSQSTGFYRDIPVNNGAQVRDVKVKKITEGGALTDVYYDVLIDSFDYLSIDIGSTSIKTGKSESYRINYIYRITNSVVNKSMLPVNPIGHGWQCTISDANVKLVLPDGYVSAKAYAGATGSTATLDFAEGEENGRTVLTASVSYLGKYNGVTFDITFKDGAISNYFDATPYYFIAVGAVIFAVLIVLRLLVFNKSELTPIVNYEAPNRMDPLIMGKLIDNKVNGEDVTAMIFYWASKGYVMINLDDKNNPVLIRIVQNLPDTCPQYEKLMYNNLFAGGDAVNPSSLSGKFYRTVEQVTAQVNAQTKGLYESKSIGLSIVFTIIAGALLGLVPLVVAYFQISTTFMFFTAFIALVPSLLIYAAAERVMYNKLKFTRKKLLLFSSLIALACVVFVALYTLILPSHFIGIVPKILLCTVCCCIIALSVSIISRTKEYKEKLNDIVGFKNFITLAEKDQLVAMLEEDPQFYYNILPYAQVLGVSDLWEDKFKALTVAPPKWLTGNTANTLLEFHIINSYIRSTSTRMSTNLVSRPSSSGTNGGGRGGFTGGFSGGGFGGGGGRGR